MFYAKKIHTQVVLVSPVISSQFTVEMCTAAKNCRKVNINPFFGGGSRSSMLTNIKSQSPVFVMICSMSVYLQPFSHQKSQ